jgi:hypothetical protein
LHNKPQACGASVASAAEPFTKTKKKNIQAFGRKTLRKYENAKNLDVDWKTTQILKGMKMGDFGMDSSGMG